MSSGRLPDPARRRSSGKLQIGKPLDMSGLRASGSFTKAEPPRPSRPPTTGVMRLRRWMIPASAIALAVAALGSLATSVLIEEGLPARRATRPQRVVFVLPSVEKTAPAVALAPPTKAPASAPAPFAALVSRPRVAPARLESPRSPRSPEIVAAPLATPATDVAVLARAENVVERFHALAAIAARGGDAAVASLEALLDADLPGSPYEQQQLRLAIVGKIGELPGPRVDALLVARLDAQCPRPERVLALEALQNRPGVGRSFVEDVARDDHDPLVRDKARQLLAREH